MTALLSLMLAIGMTTQSTPKPGPAPAPARPATTAAKPPPQPPGKSAPAKPAPSKPAPPLTPSPLEVCDYITIDEARGLLGAEVTPTTAPSRGGLTSCGYTSPNGDAITLSIADYGIPFVAQQFFDQTRKALKMTANEETLGVPAFSYTIFAGPVPTPPTPSGSPGAKPAAPGAAPGATPPPTPAPVNTPPGISLVALKEQRIVTLGAVGLTAGGFDQLPKIRAIVTRVLATLTPAAEASPRDE